MAVFSNSRINLNLSNASTREGRRWQIWRRGHVTSQIKGRNFEIPGCGGFMLTDLAENLYDYYTPGRDIAIFTHERDLVAQVWFYLEHESLRRDVAESGYQRTLAEHTYARRFEEIFQIMGLISSTRRTPFHSGSS